MKKSETKRVRKRDERHDDGHSKLRLALGAAGLFLFIVGARKTFEWTRGDERMRVTDGRLPKDEAGPNSERDEPPRYGRPRRS